MDISTIQETVGEHIGYEEGDERLAFSVLVTKMGQWAEAKLRFALIPDIVERPVRKVVLADILSASMIALAQAAEEEGIDLEKEVKSRIEELQEQQEKEAEIEEALEDGDIDGLADALREDVEDAGVFDNNTDNGDVDDPDGWGVY